MRGKNQRSLRWKLMGWSILIFLPLLSMLVSLTYFSVYSEISKREESLLASADTFAAMVDRELNGIITTLQALSASSGAAEGPSETLYAELVKLKQWLLMPCNLGKSRSPRQFERGPRLPTVLASPFHLPVANLEAKFRSALLSDVLNLDIKLALLDGFHDRPDGVGKILPLIDLNGGHPGLQFDDLAAIPSREIAAPCPAHPIPSPHALGTINGYPSPLVIGLPNSARGGVTLAR